MLRFDVGWFDVRMCDVVWCDVVLLLLYALFNHPRR